MIMPTETDIRRYLLECRELSLFCSQNGWIDDDSIEFQLSAHTGDCASLAVGFVEVIMKGAGCEGRRLPCFGQLRLQLDRDGRIESGRPI